MRFFFAIHQPSSVCPFRNWSILNMCAEAQTTAHFCGMKTLHTAGDYTSREEGTKKRG